MDEVSELPAYQQRTWGLTKRNIPILAPVGLAVTWLLLDAVHGSLSIGTLILSGITGAFGVLGLLFVLTPVELIADRQGLTWRQFFYKRAIPWEQVESVGVAISKRFEGYNNGTVNFLTNSVKPAHLPKIGVNLRLTDRNPLTVSYKRGFTGFELNWTNVFKTSTSEIVEELEARLQQSRRANGG